MISKALLSLLLIFCSAASSPTSAPFDPSTPKGALKVFSRALSAGDKKTTLQLLAADSDGDKKLAEAIADLAEATAALKKAAVEAFGAAHARALGADRSAPAEALARIDAASETITAEKAVLRMSDSEGPPMNLIKRDGQWKIPVAELSKDVETADVEKNLTDLMTQIAAMRQIAQEIAAGKFATAADARQALDQRILKGMLPPLQSATSPSTKPSAVHSG